MSDKYKRVELLANIAIIVVALLIGVVLVRRYLLPVPTDVGHAEVAQVKPGTRLSLPGLDWGKSDKTLLLVLSADCRYCTESAPFYRRLAEQRGGRQDVRLIAVLPQGVGTARQYLGGLGVAVDEIAQATPAALNARATPTLIVVDRTGSVVQSWVGMLPAEKEAEVVRTLLDGRAGA